MLHVIFVSSHVQRDLLASERLDDPNRPLAWTARLRVPYLRLAVLTGGDAREDRCVRVRYERLVQRPVGWD